MTREQEAIERIEGNVARMMGEKAYEVANRIDGMGDDILNVLLAPSPCPTCGGTGSSGVW